MFNFLKNEIIIRFILVAIVVSSCANPRPPSGGPPDKTPPKVIEFSPKNFSTNFSGKEIVIKFNKWVDRNSVVNNIFINPPIKYEINWSRKKVYIRFAENLPENTTFSILLGTNYNDLDGNKPSEPFALFFSTGQIIDTGKILGRVISDIQQNVFIYSFPLVEVNKTDFDINKAFHYRTQPDNLGLFRFEALRRDSFIVFAYADKNNNKEFDNGIENFGLYSHPIPADFSFSDTCSIILNPPKDEVAPILIDANALENHTIKLTFSEPISFKQIPPINFVKMLDTVTKKIFVPYFSFININNKKELFVFFKDTLPEGILSVVVEDSSVITDTAGNTLKIQKPILFRISRFKENVPLYIQEKQLQISSLKDNIFITFSLPLDTFKSEFYVRSIDIEQKDTHQVQTTFTDLNVISISIQNLRWRSQFAIEIKADSIFDYLGKKYTNFQHTVLIKVDDEPRYGSLQGLLLARLDTILGQPMILAFSQKRKLYTKVINNRWKFEQIPEDEYYLIAFYDMNRNELYDAGRIKPLQLSERIIKVSPKISVRKGWTIEEIRF